LINFSLHLLCS